MTKKIQDYKVALVAAFDARAEYETAKNADNDSIQKTLKDMRVSVDHDSIAEIMLSANVDSNFINRSERKTARFNVYSAQKVVNVARAIASAETLNHYTKAILASAVALQSNEMLLTHKDASAACSLSVKSDSKRDKLLKKYQKHVAANTAATQSSSSINALQMFDVLQETRDDANNVCYRVNLDSATTQKLIA